MNKGVLKNQQNINVYIYRTILILVCLVLVSVVYYFVYALPHYNTEKLEIERAKQEQSILDKEAQVNLEKEKQEQMVIDKEAQIDLEREKLEIRNRETQIKEEANQRQADEAKLKNKIVSEHQAKIDWCENAKAKLIAKGTLTAVDTQNFIIISEECDRLRAEYNL